MSLEAIVNTTATIIGALAALVPIWYATTKDHSQDAEVSSQTAGQDGQNVVIKAGDGGDAYGIGSRGGDGGSITIGG